MGLFDQGLFGMGGIGGMSGNARGQALLGGAFDPQEQKRQMLKQGLLGAGIAMLGDGNIASGMRGGLEGAYGAQQGYMQNAKTAMEMNAQKTKQAQEERQQAAIMQWIDGLPPDQQEYAHAFPEQAAQEYAKTLYPKPEDSKPIEVGGRLIDPKTYKPLYEPPAEPPKAPTMETLYDERTGQPYKGQFNPKTGAWDRVGGVKAGDAGITITNPDGTTTQIGGSGTKSTEADRRAQLLTNQIVGQEADLMQAFDSLATGRNTMGSAVPGGRGIMSGEGQNADDALKNVAANWLYLTSGATATDAEVARQFSMIKPTVFDKPENIIAKKARLQSMIDTMKMRSNIPVAPPNAGLSGKTSGGTTWSVVPQ
jgi:hypothetical protein